MASRARFGEKAPATGRRRPYLADFGCPTLSVVVSFGYGCYMGAPLGALGQ
jgi:hypothetical protein